MGRGLDIVYTLGGALTSPVWGVNLLRTGKWRTDWKGRFGRGEAVTGEGLRLLIHAVSVGEVNATRSLVEHFEKHHPDWTLIISVTTNTGHDRAKQLYSGKHAVVRYPLDFTDAVRSFLDRTRPDVVALMELEVWPNFVQACVQREVKVCVINGRLTERSYRRYQRLGPLVYRTFAQLSAAGVQTEAYAERFKGLGVAADRVHVLDTMKWDTAAVMHDVPGAAELAAHMGIDRSKPLIVAGSTGPGEEKLLIESQPKGVQLLLVPRKPERFEAVAQLSKGIVRRTQPPAGTMATGESGVFLLDTMGELRKAYALADVVIVGRSFSPTEKLGGSDPIEPAALGKAVVIGRDCFNFADVVDAFVAGGGMIVADDVMAAANELLKDKTRATQLASAAREVIATRRGATGRYAELLIQDAKAPQ